MSEVPLYVGLLKKGAVRLKVASSVAAQHANAVAKGNRTEGKVCAVLVGWKWMTYIGWDRAATAEWSIWFGISWMSSSASKTTLTK